MKVKAIIDFKDIETKEMRIKGDVFECNDELANTRIKKGLVEKVNEKPIKIEKTVKKEK